MKNIFKINEDIEKEQTEEFLKEYRKLVLKYKRDITAGIQIVKVNITPEMEEKMIKENERSEIIKSK
jgi:hypothetical protein